jgi:hypothetical protein
MTIYLWHLVGPVVLTLSVVLPGIWPAPPVGSAGWWAARVAWVAFNAIIITPVVVLMGRFEQPPAGLGVTVSGVRTAAAVALCLVGWAAVAITGVHVPAWPGAVPWLQLVALGCAAALLLRGRDARVSG